MRLDFPEPETPVTEVSTPSGIDASSARRLLRVTSFKVKNSFDDLRFSGSVEPEVKIYFPVMDLSIFLRRAKARCIKFLPL